MRSRPVPKVKSVHRHAWLWEPLLEDPTTVVRSMFGTKALYVHGRLTLCFAIGEEPWRGVLVCTDHPHHPFLVAEHRALIPHPLLPKWLYLPEADPAFETVAQRLVRQVRHRDPRIGVEPKPRASKRRARAPRGRSTHP